MGSTDDDNPKQMPGDIPEGRPINGSTWRDGGGMCGLALMRCTKVRLLFVFKPSSSFESASFSN